MPSGSLIHFNPAHYHPLSAYFSPNTIADRVGYIVVDAGNYIRFVDRNGLTYIVPRKNTSTRMVGTHIVYYVTGPYYSDMNPLPVDRELLAKFLSINELHH